MSDNTKQEISMSKRFFPGWLPASKKIIDLEFLTAYLRPGRSNLSLIGAIRWNRLPKLSGTWKKGIKREMSSSQSFQVVNPSDS
jgi:hypothetical protein